MYAGCVGGARSGKSWRRCHDWTRTWCGASFCVPYCIVIRSVATAWTGWYAAPLGIVEARVEAEDLSNVTGVLSGELDGLCIAAAALEPPLAHGAAASACGFLSGSAPPRDDCFSSLMTNGVPNAKPKRNLDLTSCIPMDSR